MTSGPSGHYYTSLRTRLLTATLWGVLGTIAVLGLANLLYQARYARRIFPGVYVQGLPVGGLTRADAATYVASHLEDSLPYAVLADGERRWTVSAASLGGVLDLEAAVGEAWRMGRASSFLSDMHTRYRLLWRGYDISPLIRLEPGPAKIPLRTIARQVSSPSRSAQLWVGGLQAHTGSPESGRELDVQATRLLAERCLNEGVGGSRWQDVPRLVRLWRGQDAAQRWLLATPVEVPIVYREVVPPLTEVDGADQQVAAILSEPLVLIAELPEIGPDGTESVTRRRYLVDEAMLASWLALAPAEEDQGRWVVELDEARVAAYVQDLARALSQPPREGRFVYQPISETIDILTPGAYGYSLDAAATLRAIVEAAQHAGNREIALPVHIVPPRVTYEDLRALLPLALLGEGVGSYAGSTSERSQNVRAAAGRMHGLVIPAGASFSFLGQLGSATAAQGYARPPALPGERQDVGLPDGIGLVSTVCFRAAFWSGLPILSRYSHGYRVASLEPPLGLDAAVLPPDMDLEFRNDTDAPIVLVAAVDASRGTVAVRLYGAPTGRQVSAEGPQVERTPSAAGDILDVTVTRLITTGEETTTEEVVSRYWPAPPTPRPIR